MTSLSPTRGGAEDPVGALAWRNRTSLWRITQYLWKTGILPIFLVLFGISAILIGDVLLQARGSPVFLHAAMLSLIVVLDMVIGSIVGALGAFRLFSRQWNDILLPIDWSSFLRERRQRQLPWLIVTVPILPAFLVFECAPLPIPWLTVVKLFLVFCWVYVSSVFTIYYLTICAQFWFGKLPVRVSTWLRSYGVILIIPITYVAFFVAIINFRWDEVVAEWLASAPVALVLARTLRPMDLVGIAASILIPSLLAEYAEPKVIRLRLPAAVYLAAERDGALSPERPLKPGLWTDIRRRLRSTYRDTGGGSRAISGLMLTLGLRSGLMMSGVVFGGLSLSLGVIFLITGHGWYVSMLAIGLVLAIFSIIIGIFAATLVTVPGTPGGYSTVRLLPFSGNQLFRAHGEIVWPTQLAVAGGVGLLAYALGGGPMGWLVFGTVLTTELFATWGSQTGVFSGSGGPHGKGISTTKLQFGVAALCLFLLYPIEAYVAFTVEAPTDLVLDLYLLLILAINVSFVAGLTKISIRRYANPPSRGAASGTSSAGISRP